MNVYQFISLYIFKNKYQNQQIKKSNLHILNLKYNTRLFERCNLMINNSLLFSNFKCLKITQ